MNNSIYAAIAILYQQNLIRQAQSAGGSDFGNPADGLAGRHALLFTKDPQGGGLGKGLPNLGVNCAAY